MSSSLAEANAVLAKSPLLKLLSADLYTAKKRASAVAILSSSFVPLNKAMTQISELLPIQAALHLPDAPPYKAANTGNNGNNGNNGNHGNIDNGSMSEGMSFDNTGSGGHSRDVPHGDDDIGATHPDPSGHTPGPSLSAAEAYKKKMKSKINKTSFKSSSAQQKSKSQSTDVNAADGVLCWVNKMVATAATALIDR